MFSTSNFNSVVDERLHRKYPHNVKIQYGLDAGKFQGVKQFPLGNFESSFRSNAKPNVDSYLFHSKSPGSGYNIPVSKKYAPPVAEPYLFNAPINKTMPQRKNAGSFVAKMYGMPPDKDIIIESTAGQVMNLEHGGMTETKFMMHNYRKEFGGDGRFFELITGKPNADESNDDYRDDSKDDNRDESKGGESKEESKEESKSNFSSKSRQKVVAKAAFEDDLVPMTRTPDKRSKSPQRAPNPMEHRTLLVKSREPSAKEIDDEPSAKETGEDLSEEEKEEIIKRDQIIKKTNLMLSTFQMNPSQDVPKSKLEEINDVLEKEGLEPISKRLTKYVSVIAAIEKTVNDGQGKGKLESIIKNASKIQKARYAKLLAEASKEVEGEIKKVQKKSTDTVSTRDVNLDV